MPGRAPWYGPGVAVYDWSYRLLHGLDRPAARIGLLASVLERRFGESALAFYRWSDGEAG